MDRVALGFVIGLLAGLIFDASRWLLVPVVVILTGYHGFYIVKGYRVGRRRLDG